MNVFINIIIFLANSFALASLMLSKDKSIINVWLMMINGAFMIYSGALIIQNGLNEEK